MVSEELLRSVSSSNANKDDKSNTDKADDKSKSEDKKSRKSTKVTREINSKNSKTKAEANQEVESKTLPENTTQEKSTQTLSELVQKTQNAEKESKTADNIKSNNLNQTSVFPEHHDSEIHILNQNTEGETRVEHFQKDQKPSNKLIDPRRTRIIIQRISPLSMMKIGFTMSFIFGLIFALSILLIWLFLTIAGIFSSLSDTISGMGFSTSQIDILGMFNFYNILSFVLVCVCIFTIVITFLSLFFAIIYNAVVKLIGGLKITLGDD